MRYKPLYVTFDTNTYSLVVRPQVSKIFSGKSYKSFKERCQSIGQRLSWWYLGYCIKKGRIVGGISETSLKAEALKNTDRLTLLTIIGTPAAATPPAIPKTRQEIIDSAFAIGMRVLHSPRVGYPAVFIIPANAWAADVLFSANERNSRCSALTRHFNDAPFEALRDFGEHLATAHGLPNLQIHAQTKFAASMNKITHARYLWREGLKAEGKRPVQHKTVEQFEKALRRLIAEWTDLDVVASHYAYGYDVLCTEDHGGPPNAIFSPRQREILKQQFDLKLTTATELTKLCLRRFQLPIRSWV